MVKEHFRRKKSEDARIGAFLEMVFHHTSFVHCGVVVVPL